MVPRLLSMSLAQGRDEVAGTLVAPSTGVLTVPVSPAPLAPGQDEVAERLVERLEDCTRKFPSALVLGGAGAQVRQLCLLRRMQGALGSSL